MAAIAAPENVIVHPLVLLSAVDHYDRVAKDTKKRVVGVLLGQSWKGTVDITNSFAVPFEEDKKDPSVWYIDHNYLETMTRMFRKVQVQEKIVGFYSTGPKIKGADLKIESMFREKYCAHPVFVIIDIRAECVGVPCKAYTTVEMKKGEGHKVTRQFKYLPCTIGAEEAEEVGVEHCIRDVNDPSISVLGKNIREKTSGLKELRNRLEQMTEYLSAVLDGRLPPNNTILYNLQHIFNLLPNLASEELVQSFNHKSNDQYLVVYISALVRSITALHDLVVNKIKYKESDVDGGESTSTDSSSNNKGKIADGDTDMKDAAKGEEAKKE